MKVIFKREGFVMKPIVFILFLLSLFISPAVNAQIDTVIVEKYYVSDANDAQDTTASGTPTGNLAIGSFTYRIYIDLCDSCSLQKIYGDANHALKFSSDSIFFNHKLEGKSFGNGIKSARFKLNPTVALDSWLTLCNATSNRAGVLKTEDTNSVSMLGGTASSGLLINNDPAAGIPLTTQDGLTQGATIGLSSGGDLDFTFNPDLTIFGGLVVDSVFASNNALLQLSGGVKGPTPTNRVLVAQLTTQGQIRFELNMIVIEKQGQTTTTYTLVANSNVGSEILSPYLTYPPQCGCTNKKYLEYNPMAPCLDSTMCKTLKVFGCTDPFSCNYDPAANVSLAGYCCYPGNCQDRDLSQACPNLSERYSIFPNPAQQGVAIELYSPGEYETRYEIYDMFGRVIVKKAVGIFSGTKTEYEDVSWFPNGMYLVRIFTGETYFTKTLIKN